MAYIATTDISDSSVSLSIVNQVRLYIAVYYDSWKGGKLICLARGPHPMWFVCLADFSLWFMLLFIDKVATFIAVELS